MTRNERFYPFLAAAVLLAAASCSNVDGPVLPGDGDAAYFPNRDGSKWVYRYHRYFNLVPFGRPYDFVEEFTGSAVVAGGECQKLKRFVLGFEDTYEILFLADDEANYVRWWGREYYAQGVLTTGVYFQPPWDYLVYPLRVNYSWSEAKRNSLTPAALGLPEDLDNDGRADTVDVEIVHSVLVKEDLSLPIGTFPGCYKIRRTIYATFHMTTGGDAEEVYVQYRWFKPDVGVVQSSGDEVSAPNAARYTFLASLKDYYIPAASIGS